MIKLVCQYCKKEFLVFPYRLKYNVKFCSYKCKYSSGLSEQTRQRMSKTWFKEGHKPPHTLNLNKSLLYDLYIIQKKTPFEIANLLHCNRNTITKYLKLNNIPLRKGGWILNKNIRKKMSEVAKQNNFGKWMLGRKLPEEVKQKVKEKIKEYYQLHNTKVNLNCKVCDKEFIVAKGRGNLAQFCSRKCKNIGFIGKLAREKNPAWQGGISREPYGFDFDEELKNLIRKRDQYKCRKCGAPQEEFIKKLPIHHVDYDKKNNAPINLLTLCNGCNSEVNANREYWKELFSQEAHELLTKN